MSSGYDFRLGSVEWFKINCNGRPILLLWGEGIIFLLHFDLDYFDYYNTIIMVNVISDH